MQNNPLDPSLTISIFQYYKIIEYIKILAKNPEGLSRVEIREKVPISAGPEIKCTDYLFENELIDNIRVLKGKKFKLNKKGERIWTLFQVVDLYLRKINSSTIPTEQELLLFKMFIEDIQSLTNQFSKKKKHVDNISTAISQRTFKKHKQIDLPPKPLR
jgi:hypothetical protein